MGSLRSIARAVSFTTEAFEVTSGGTVAWHLVVDGVMTLFRVEPITSFEP